MSIDERLEFLLTLQQSHDDQIVKLVEQGALNSAAIGALAGRMDVLTERTIQAMDAINRLAHIAQSHDQRIEDLENRRPSP